MCIRLGILERILRIYLIFEIEFELIVTKFIICQEFYVGYS